MFKLHWLPVKLRLKYKILLMTYKAIHVLTPDYIQRLVQIKKKSLYNLLLLIFYFLTFSNIWLFYILLITVNIIIISYVLNIVNNLIVNFKVHLTPNTISAKMQTWSCSKSDLTFFATSEIFSSNSTTWNLILFVSWPSWWGAWVYSGFDVTNCFACMFTKS